MQQKEHQAIIDLIPAYTLNSLDADEDELVTRHLATCDHCREELAAFERVVDLLPLAAPEIEPSEALKERLMRQIQTFQAEKEISSRTSPSSVWRQFTIALSDFLSGPGWQPVALLAILVLLIGGFFIWQQSNQPTRQFVLTSTDVSPWASGVIELAGNGRQATLSVIHMPKLDPDMQYQLWLIQDGQRTSGGVFSVKADGSQKITIHAPRPLTEFSAFGITIEPAGGSPGPTGERVLGFGF